MIMPRETVRSHTILKEHVLFREANAVSDQREVSRTIPKCTETVPSPAERVQVMALIAGGVPGGRVERRMEGADNDSHVEACVLPKVGQPVSIMEGNKTTERSREQQSNEGLERICSQGSMAIEGDVPGFVACGYAARTPGVDSRQVLKRRRYTYHTRPRRKPLEPSSMKRRRFFESRSTKEEDFREWGCCKSLSCFKRGDLQLFRDKREYLLAASQQMRKDFLSTLLRRDGKFEFDQRRVCAQFLLLGFGFSKDLQRAVKGTDSIKAMKTAAKHEEPGANARQRKLILGFLEHWVSYQVASQEVPEKVSLPFLQKKHIYRLFLRNIKAKEREDNRSYSPPSFSYFVSVWNKYYSRERIASGMECEHCVEFREALTDDNTSAQAEAMERRAEVLSRRSAHFQIVERERASYLMRKNMGNAEPQKVWSLAIGGLQQSCFGLPHSWDFRLSQSRQFMKFKANVVSLLDNGPQTSLHLFIHINQFTMSCSILIEIIHRFVNKKAAEGKRSKVLLIDVNIARAQVEEVYFLSYLECLVAWDVFEEIQVFFALPGHVHSDLQLGARCTAEALTKGDVLTLDELEKELHHSHPSEPHTSIIWTAANFAGLLDKERSLRELQHTLSRFRMFRFSRATDVIPQGTGKFSTSCSVRENGTESWVPLFRENPGYGLLVKAPDLPLTPAISTAAAVVNGPQLELRQQSKELSFHWDLRRCEEGRGSRFSRQES